MNIEYTHTEGGPTDPFELAVIEAGYKWVRTNTIVATRPGAFKPDLPVDRLNPHKHSGHNTHLIVAGDLGFEIERDYYDPAKLKFQSETRPLPIVTANLDAADPDARKELYALRQHRYNATSQSACSFVEGHQFLSPSTAERFIARGTLRAIIRRGKTTERPGLTKTRSAPCFAKQDGTHTELLVLDNYGKPEMIWDEDADGAEAEKPRTLRNGKARPEIDSKKDKIGPEGEKTTIRSRMTVARNLKISVTTIWNTKGVLIRKPRTTQRLVMWKMTTCSRWRTFKMLICYAGDDVGAV
ncbi:hypothetical protein PG994_008280 [Apiospora phragmitis]|uniref:Uncharacterized protein n=1 Tax=Apiospora phragmitis TaxID=2905665 RepID=A0ABR1USK9_9PEZI